MGPRRRHVVNGTFERYAQCSQCVNCMGEGMRKAVTFQVHACGQMAFTGECPAVVSLAKPGLKSHRAGGAASNSLAWNTAQFRPHDGGTEIESAWIPEEANVFRRHESGLRVKRCQLLSSATPSVLIDRHCQEEHDAAHGVLVERFHIHQAETIVEATHQHCAK
jgi:hypothetical protein